MKGRSLAAWVGVLSLLVGSCLQAQQADSRNKPAEDASAQAAATPIATTLPPTAATTGSAASTVVPRLVQFTGTVTDSVGKPATGTVAVTFSLYELQEGGAPLWSETQNLALDSQGHYTVLLGVASSAGLPLDLFSTGAARWLGVAPALPGVGELPRVLLVGVPYALKAADADTLGGKPASAFVTTESQGVATVGASPTVGSSSANGPRSNNTGSSGATNGEKTSKATNSTTITGSGTTNFVPLWTGSSTLGNSALFQSGSKIGLGTTTPTQLLQVNGAGGILSSGAGGALYFQMRDSSVQSAWYGFGNVSRFWRSDQNGGKGGDIIAVNSAGQVGIGTDSPSNALQVNGASEILSTGSGAGFKFGMRDSGTTTSVWYGTGNVSRFWRSDKGDIIGVTSAGNVGIGTDAPASTLEVNGTSKFDQAVTFAGGQTFPGTATLGSNTFVGTESVTGGVTASNSSGVAGTFTSNNEGSLGLTAQGGGNTSQIGTGGAGLQGTGGADATGGAGVVGVGGGSDDGSPGAGLEGTGGGSLFANGAAGVVATGGSSSLGTGGDGIDAFAGGGFFSIPFAGNFSGNLNVSGAITAGTKDFKIDHPLDPANKYLYHASVESSEMMNIYTGNVRLDASGAAVVRLPDWFQAENADFRYQLTAIGAPAPGLYIAEEVENNHFKIAGGSPGGKVSWQVTGVRQDAYAKAHPLNVAVEKPATERGYYIHPELYGAPEEKGIEWARHPEMMKRMKEMRQKSAKLAQGNSPQ